eukprot:c18023_g2_i1 orf=1-198(-)
MKGVEQGLYPSDMEGESGEPDKRNEGEEKYKDNPCEPREVKNSMLQVTQDYRPGIITSELWEWGRE